MKTATFGLFAAAFFLFASAMSLADERNPRFEGARGDGWRLGERVRDGYAIYHRGYRVPGAAIAIADGWVLGTKRESGGYAIYRWNGHSWDQAPGGAVKIGGTYRRPWVINNRGQRYIWNGYDWDVDFRASRSNSFGRDRDRDRDWGWDWDREWARDRGRTWGRDWGKTRSHDKRHDRGRYSFQRGFLGKEFHKDRDRHDRDRSDRRRTRW